MRGCGVVPCGDRCSGVSAGPPASLAASAAPMAGSIWGFAAPCAAALVTLPALELGPWSSAAQAPLAVLFTALWRPRPLVHGCGAMSPLR
eukprot:4308206-Pyramimonas_sp.AAC.1